MKSHVVVENLIFDKTGNILLVKRSETAPRRPLEWDLPGGWVAAAEAPTDAAIREATEEAGLMLTAPELVYSTTRMGEQTVVYLFFASTDVQGTVSLSYEHVEYAWVGLEEAVKKIKYEVFREALEWVLTHKDRLEL